MVVWYGMGIIKNKGGRLPVDRQFILDYRSRIVIQLVAKKWMHKDIATLFNVDRSAITHIVKRLK